MPNGKTFNLAHTISTIHHLLCAFVWFVFLPRCCIMSVWICVALWRELLFYIPEAVI